MRMYLPWLVWVQRSLARSPARDPVAPEEWRNEKTPKKKGKTHNPFTPPFSFSTNFFYFDRIDPFLYFLICGKAFLTKFSLFIDFIYHFLLFYLILTFCFCFCFN